MLPTRQKLIQAKNQAAPRTEEELLDRCVEIEGLTFLQLAELLQSDIPDQPSKCKGWTGQAMERALHTTAGSQSLPDFHHLGIELKTIPLNGAGKPAESTFITSIPLLTIHHQAWQTSQCRQKLQRILWIPVEGDSAIPFEARRIGQAKLWSMNEAQENSLRNDWQELTAMIGQGQLEDITAHLGEYLQVRPKAMNANSLCYGFNGEGNKILTLPRGFYLRSRFTESLLCQNYLK